MTVFGHALRPLWRLGEGTFLNHGSFGACPLEVIQAQDALRAEMEAQPDMFFREKIMPRDHKTPLRMTADALAAFVGADEIAFVENATTGIQAVLNHFPLARGDAVLVTNHTYAAVGLMAQAWCAARGAILRTVSIPFGADDAEIISAFETAAGPDVKLAIVDHLTSPTALQMPLERIIATLKARGIRVLVDGAHAVGQLPLNLAALGADWYVSNAHKWLYAPRGTALLYAAPDVRAMTQPHIVSHFDGLGYPRAFDYLGTRDSTGWLAIPAAITFIRKLGPEALWAHERRVIATATASLAEMGIGPVARTSAPAMRAFVVPQRRAAEADDAAQLMRTLWSQARVQVAAMVLEGKLLLRISAQAYVDAADIAALVGALTTHGWPGR